MKGESIGELKLEFERLQKCVLTEHETTIQWRAKYEAMYKKHDENVRMVEDLLRRIAALEQTNNIAVEYIDANEVNAFNNI